MMPAVVGAETFTDAITVFQNRSIHAYVSHAIKARQQLMMLQDFQLQQGWSTATDRKIRQWLVRLDRLRRKMIHASGAFAQEITDLEGLARDMNLELPAEASTADMGDAIARPSGRAIPLRNPLDGSSKDIPLISEMSIRNVDAYTLITALDLHIVTATRLDAREATHRISPEEGMMLFAGLFEMWSICDECGGDARVVGVTEGVLPSEEPNGPERSNSLIGGDDVAT